MYRDVMGDIVKSLAEIKLDNIHCYPAGCDIFSGYQIGQACFPFCESMLTTTDNLLYLRLLEDDIQNILFHHSISHFPLFMKFKGNGELVLVFIFLLLSKGKLNFR